MINVSTHIRNKNTKSGKSAAFIKVYHDNHRVELNTSFRVFYGDQRNEDHFNGLLAQHEQLEAFRKIVAVDINKEYKDVGYLNITNFLKGRYTMDGQTVSKEVSWNDQINNWIKKRKKKRIADLTRENKLLHNRRFKNFCIGKPVFEVTNTTTTKAIKKRKEVGVISPDLIVGHYKELMLDQVDAFILFLQDNGFTESTINRYLIDVKSFYKFLYNQGVEGAMYEQIELQEQPEPNAVRAMSMEQVRAFMRLNPTNKTEKNYHWVFIAMLESGVRWSDVGQLVKSNVSSDGKTVEIIPRKTSRFNKKAEIPFTKRLAEAMKNMNLAKVNNTTANHMITKLCSRVGVDFLVTTKTTRRTLVNVLLEKDVPTAIICRITCHNAKVMNKYYVEFKRSKKVIELADQESLY